MAEKVKLTEIKVFIWDVDGTLYRPNQMLHDEIRRTEIQTVADYLNLKFKKAEEEFYRIYPSQTPSGTKAAAIAAGISVSEAAIHMDKMANKLQFTGYDQELVRLFSGLKSFQHFILSNGSIVGIKKLIIHLGLNLDIFTEIVTSETVGDNKPSLKGFQYIISKYHLEPCEVMMVGDREQVDIIPAKKVGMRTCLAWGKSKIADISIKEIYDLTSFL